MKNGEFWYDTDGNIIHAHGGWILKAGDYYYWYGENRSEDIYVSCYRTKDFKTFEFRNHVLTSKSEAKKSYVENANLKLFTPLSDLGEFTRGGLKRVINEEKLLINIERPKVIYCEKTGKYVMWMHYETVLTTTMPLAPLPLVTLPTVTSFTTEASVLLAICRAIAQYMPKTAKCISPLHLETIKTFTYTV